MKLWCDLDGVLADFDAAYETLTGAKPDKAKDNVDWQLVRAVPGWYAGIPEMADAKELMDFIAPLSPTILTGVPEQVGNADIDKRLWVLAHFGSIPVITTRSSQKWTYAAPGDILIDDWTKYRVRWESVGGVFVEHTSAADTIRQLMGLGVSRK